MTDFTKEDVQQWKTNPVTKAFILAIEVNLKNLENGLLNYCEDNLVTFGNMQGRRQTCIEILDDVKNADFEILSELVKETKEVKNDNS